MGFFVRFGALTHRGRGCGGFRCIFVASVSFSGLALVFFEWR